MADQAVIIGAGQAGAQAAQSLRQAGFSGRIVMVGAEPHLPYQRPPLSKGYLKGEVEPDRLLLRPGAFFDREQVDVLMSTRIAEIDRKAGRVRWTGGDLAYDRLLLATGAPPRRIVCPGSDLAGVHYLRTLDDSDALRPMLRSTGRLVIIGAGYIGLEVAAVARAAAKDVTVLEAASRVLARVAPPALSHFYERAHREQGVDLHLGAEATRFEGRGRVEAVVLKSGERIPCAEVLVGIGALPETGLAAAAGLEVSNGVVVDETAASSDPQIYAAGDMTNFPSRLYGRRLRLESVPNAIEQAKAAAAGMAGSPAIYDSVPWFWSDQYELKLQTAGLSDGADATILRGDLQARRFSLWSLLNGVVIAADCVNDPAAFAAARRMIAARATPSPDRLADPQTDVKSLI